MWIAFLCALDIPSRSRCLLQPKSLYAHLLTAGKRPFNGGSRRWCIQFGRFDVRLRSLFFMFVNKIVLSVLFFNRSFMRHAVGWLLTSGGSYIVEIWFSFVSRDPNVLRRGISRHFKKLNMLRLKLQFISKIITWNFKRHLN